MKPNLSICRRGKTLALMAIFIIVITSFVFISLELMLRKCGFIPGVLAYNSLGISFGGPLVKMNYIAADENGMNYFTSHGAAEKARKHINDQGFLSPLNFDTQTALNVSKEGRKKILLVGDSNVEGVSGNWDTRFVEQLRALRPNDAIFDAGVVGTDLEQYIAVVEHFAPILNPDVVVVCVCWNDIVRYRTPLEPYIPTYYMTSWGGLKSTVPIEFTGGERVILRSSEEAMEYYRRHFTFSGRNDLISRLCNHSCVITSAYQTYQKVFHNKYISKDAGLTARNLRKISGIVAGKRSKFLIVFIPNARGVDGINPHRYRKEYGDDFLEFFPSVNFPPLVSSDYISVANNHLNDTGNKKLASFVGAKLDSILDLPPN